ncbi:unnamed protein product [Darwinula stevensoni]|uniref:Pre-rRNA-processing protein TSR2 homolog n=1 Tax=Darwinula stevensoni TaxID=69355 RepID=A0A7R8XFR2_9CRUS|nr:unnamed protein product [Darwinula stevensoni]CAG0895333.1 unnamed protein product [Darwinula stevensoni]
MSSAWGPMQGPYGANLEPHEVAYYLEEVLDSEFNTIMEDGSVDVVSKDLVAAFTALSRKDFAQLHAILPKPILSSSNGNMPTLQSQSPSSRALEEVMEVDDAQLHVASTSQDDGWTVVKSKKRNS